ncbi:uncharacterized protein [Coffea arabica]|uniref:Endonuclease/exonuclease/phosphatase domain-containing protein n=1 Tax=Coffea arabica TaxID=13443 RepID=A0ABM4UEV2_COFAR
MESMEWEGREEQEEKENMKKIIFDEGNCEGMELAEGLEPTLFGAPSGLAGGLAMLWKQELKVKKVLFTSFTIELLIDDSEIGAEWWCIYVYASADASIRREQWKVIARRRCIWGESWAIMGDLNDIRSNAEKWGGRQRADVSFQDFNSFINGNELVDISYERVPWTWCNNWKREGEMKERIDRILGNKGWIRKFGKANCAHIEAEASDHCILLLDTKLERKKWKRRFVFDRRWLQHGDIEEVRSLGE